MVEMVETAAILNQATERSLVILDEIGRGTATFDGLAIAWAAAEHLHEANRSRALFATHYHEMTALAERLERACLRHHARQRMERHASSSCTRWRRAPPIAPMAFMSPSLQAFRAAVIARAEDVLKALEEGREGHKPLARIDELPLFQSAPPPRCRPRRSRARSKRRLRAVSPDSLTPKEALELIYTLKAKLDREG